MKKKRDLILFIVAGVFILFAIAIIVTGVVLMNKNKDNKKENEVKVTTTEQERFDIVAKKYYGDEPCELNKDTVLSCSTQKGDPKTIRTREEEYFKTFDDSVNAYFYEVDTAYQTTTCQSQTINSGSDYNYSLPKETVIISLNARTKEITDITSKVVDFLKPKYQKHYNTLITDINNINKEKSVTTGTFTSNCAFGLDFKNDSTTITYTGIDTDLNRVYHFVAGNTNQYLKIDSENKITDTSKPTNDLAPISHEFYN